MVVPAVPCGDVLREEESFLHRAWRPQTGLKAVMPCRPKRDRNLVAINEADVLFPSVPKFVSSSQLSTVKSVFGVMRHLTAAKVAHDGRRISEHWRIQPPVLGGGNWCGVPT